MATPNFFTISPFVMGVRLERIANHIEHGRIDKAVKLCDKYIAAFSTTPVTVPVESTEVVKELELCVLFMLCGASEIALQSCNDYRQIYETQLKNFAEVNNLLMDPTAGQEHIGTLERLPMIARDAIMKVIRNDFW